MLWECEYWEMEPYWLEMNAYVDKTLDAIFLAAAAAASTAGRSGGGSGAPRSVFFSAFNPELCLLLAAKQRTYPVAFLSDSDVGGMAGDRRATSLQQALRLAARWGLEGVVLAAEPLVAAPGLVRHVREARGLVCGSYGAANDVPENAEVRVFVCFLSWFCCLFGFVYVCGCV
jgi:glycerophosphodiester phosphodiesterase